MLRMLWGSTAPKGSLGSMTNEEQEARLQSAIRGLELLVDDDIEGAQVIFESQDDAFHIWGVAIAEYIRAMLGFEKAVIMKSGVYLDKALASLETELSHAKAVEGSVFPVGSEYKVCISNIQLESAMLGFLDESLTSAMRSVWKLKSAYGTLHSLYNHVEKANTRAAAQIRVGNGRIGGTDQASGSPSGLSATDYFTHCGAICGFGLLTLIISLLPPKVSRVLSIIGFKGNKEQALTALWSIVDAPNIQGALAILGLLLYHGELLGLCDIVENEKEDLTKCSEALELALKRYSHSALWQLQAAKMQGRLGNLKASIKTLENIHARPQMKQIEALKMYDLGMTYIYAHRWAEAAKQFEDISARNEWSKSSYYFIIASCLVELYAATNSEAHALDAEKWFDKAAETTGSKVAGRAIPFETYLKRKINKWRTNAAQGAKNRTIDGIAVPPMVEYIHLFNGWKKMRGDEGLLQQSLAMIARTGTVKDRADDSTIRSLCETAVQRNLGDTAAAFASVSRINTLTSFRHLEDAETWCIPFIYYETACCYWARDGHSATKEMKHWIDKARAFGESEFEQRISIRCTIALQTIE